MKGSIRRKGKTWSYRMYVSTVDGQNKQIEKNYLEVTDLINVKENGEMLTHNSIKFLSRIIRDDLHIPFKFHNLRHTYATILAESGISPRYVQEVLGHSKLEFTLKYYTHITGHMADMARMAIDEKLSITN